MSTTQLETETVEDGATDAQIDEMLQKLGPSPEKTAAEAYELEQRQREVEARQRLEDDLDRVRVATLDEAIQVHSVAEVDQRLGELDESAMPHMRAAAEVWRKRRVLLEGNHQDGKADADLRRHVAQLRQRADNLREAGAVLDIRADGTLIRQGDPEADREAARLDRQIVALERELGIVAEPERPVDAIDVAVAEAQQEFQALDSKRGALALQALQGKHHAAEELGRLDARRRELEVMVEHAGIARQERARLAGEQAAAERSAELERAAETVQDASAEREESFYELADFARKKLEPLIRVALDADAAADAAIREHRRLLGDDSQPPRMRGVPGQVLGVVLRRSGIDLDDAAAMLAMQRNRIAEQWLSDRPTTSARCSVCSGQNRAEVEAALEAGRTHAEIATQYGASRSAVQRNAARHTPGLA